MYEGICNGAEVARGAWRGSLSSTIVMLLSLFAALPIGLRAQNTSASQACSAIAAGFLGCTLADNPADCAWLEGLAQTCTADTNALPRPPPPPPSPVTPCSLTISPEARPGSRGRGAMPRTMGGGTPSVPCVVLVDPVPDLVNQAGTGVVQDPASLSTAGSVVMGVTADGAARLVLRIYANSPGDQVMLTLQGDGPASLDSPNPNNLPQPYGYLQTLLQADGTASGAQITVTAVSTSAGPMAFAQYFPPSDFSRSGSDDLAQSRTFTVTAQSRATGSVNTVNLIVPRPPVVLVHGIWADPSTWSNFTPFINDKRFGISYARYDQPISVSGPNSAPTDYSTKILSTLKANAVGVNLNAPKVFGTIVQAVLAVQGTMFASAQADVVAHSLGGLMVRFSETLADFTQRGAFGAAKVHKLITIGTPHQGSPLALDVVLGSPQPPQGIVPQGPNNNCTRTFLAENGSVSFTTVAIGTTASFTNWSGAIGDLQGDGNGGSLSAAINAIQQGTGPTVPTALIAGTMDPGPQGNMRSLGCSACGRIIFGAIVEPLTEEQVIPCRAA